MGGTIIDPNDTNIQLDGDTPPDEGGRPKPFTQYRLAVQWLNANYSGSGNLLYWRGEFWSYTGTHYVRVSRDDLHKPVLAWVGPKGGSSTLASGIVDCIAAQLHSTQPGPSPFWTGLPSEGPSSPSAWLSMSNGILDVDRFLQGAPDHLRAHSPLWFCEAAIPYVFVPDAICPAWQSFLLDTFGGDLEAVRLLQQWFGYCITPDTSRHAIMLFEGVPRSGKSTIASILEHVVGRFNSVSVQLEALGSQFSMASLVGKTLAICPDAHLAKGAQAVRALECLKGISGEDSQRVERKYLPDVTAKLATRFLIVANEIPMLQDYSNALGDRLLILPFRRTARGHEDFDLLPKLMAELPGIFRWAVEGLRDLRLTSRFLEPEVSRTAKAEFNRLCSPISAFLEDHCTIADGVQVGARSLWDQWAAYCRLHGLSPGTPEQLGVRIRLLVPQVARVRPREGAARRYVYTGIAIRDTVDLV